MKFYVSLIPKIIIKMARAMFEYTKTVLSKVSFNSELFCKELEKSLQRLLPYEIQELIIWLKEFTANKPELFVCMNLIK
ncbi:MAG: hypothetical protein ACJA1B_000432 [Polaribacter sp.]|jgi:hypothetical protein